MIALDQLRGEQGLGDPLVQPFNAPRPFTHGAQQLEFVERVQDLPRPLDAARIFDRLQSLRSLRVHHAQIVPITLGPIGVAVEQQPR
jgi:hypothetical protein